MKILKSVGRGLERAGDYILWCLYAGTGVYIIKTACDFIKKE